MHNDYPLVPKKREISHDMELNCFINITVRYGIKNSSVNKLVANIDNKSKYLLHYKNLRLQFSLGIKLVSLHQILKFKQSEWLTKYIDFNTDK